MKKSKTGVRLILLSFISRRNQSYEMTSTSWKNRTDITTLIRGYNANDIVIDADRFIPLQEIRNVAFKNTEKL